MGWAEIGSPALTAAVVAFVVAFATRHTKLGLLGALIATPICLYLKDMPYLHWVSLAALPGNFLAAAALWRNRHDIAFAMLLPLMLSVVLVVILWYRNFPVFTGFRF